MSRPLREMELGEDAAKSHGVRIERSQLSLIFVAVALTAVQRQSWDQLALLL